MILATLIALLSLVQPADGTPTKPPPSGRYTVIKLSGDLDSDRLVTLFGGELDRAKDANLIILELDGNASRTDIIAKLGTRMKASRVPISILLKDPVDKKVGLGQLLLGVYAKSTFIDPATQVESGTPNLRWLAPPDTSWESIEREISGALWTRLRDRSADLALAQVLLGSKQDWWAVPGGPGHEWRLAAAAPAGGQEGPQPRQIIWGSPDGLGRITLDTEGAVGLRLCTDRAQNLIPILAHAGLAARSARTNRTVSSGLPEATSAITRTVDDCKVAVRKIAATLALKGTPTRPASNDDYHQAGTTAFAQISRALQELDKADGMLADYPELERRPVTQTGKNHTGPWRTTIDGLRKEIDKHRTTARDFQTR